MSKEIKTQRKETGESILSHPRSLYDREHIDFGEKYAEWLKVHVVPHQAVWKQQGYPSKEVYRQAALDGYYCTPFLPTQYGGKGITDCRYNAIMSEIQIREGCHSPMFGLCSDVVLPYILQNCTEEQKAIWLPKVRNGAILGIAMSEPQTGSDLQGIETTAVKDGSDYVINGNKMWISSGKVADLMLTVCYTDQNAGYLGVSIIVVPCDNPGYKCTKVLDKIGGHGNDTASIRLRNVRVPQTNLIGEEGQGFLYLMGNLAAERIGIALGAMAAARQCLATTVNYVHFRKAFGKKIGDFQHVAYKLAVLKTNIQIGTTFIDDCIKKQTNDKLNPETASMAKYWATDFLNQCATTCLQFFGGYGLHCFWFCTCFAG
jgi:alkylation response protein AidB-like acyl-CoA dehydrogenase